MADLQNLKRRMEERSRLLQEQNRIQQNIATMEALLPQLDEAREDEQADVERMESGGLTSFFYSVIGKSEEKLEKERQEAWEAETKYQDALRTLQNLYKENEDITASLDTLQDAENQYRQAFRQKRQMLLAANTPEGRRLRELEENAGQLKALGREVREAMEAGQRVMDQIERIEASVRSASGWGMVDMFSDSFISDVAKYSKLDDAQSQLRELNRLLRDYSRELKDLDVHMNISADFGGGMRFADIFFDNFLTDAMAMHRIDGLKRQVQQVRGQVERYMDLVERKNRSVAETLAQKRKEAEGLIIDA